MCTAWAAPAGAEAAGRALTLVAPEETRALRALGKPLASDFNKDIDIAPPPDVPAEAVVAEDSDASGVARSAAVQDLPLAATLRSRKRRVLHPPRGQALRRYRSFDPEAWCGDCRSYKLRRVPKKRERTDDWGYSSRHSRAIRPEAPGNSLSELSAVVDHDVFDIPHCTSGADSRRRGLLLFQIKLNAHLCLVIAERRPQAVRR